MRGLNSKALNSCFSTTNNYRKSSSFILNEFISFGLHVQLSVGAVAFCFHLLSLSLSPPLSLSLYLSFALYIRTYRPIWLVALSLSLSILHAILPLSFSRSSFPALLFPSLTLYISSNVMQRKCMSSKHFAAIRRYV